MRYKCDRCSYETDHITNFRKHLNRRSPCEDSNGSGKSIEWLKESLVEDRSDYKHTCLYCTKRFKTSQNLYQHKQRCPKKEVCELKEKIKKLENNNENHASTSSTNIVNNVSNVTNNITINIVLKDFGQEDVSHVINDKNFLDQCLKSTLPGLVSIIEKIYYDKEKPENKTVLLKSSKRQTLMVREENDWKVKPMADIVPKMVTKGKNILSTHLESNRPEYPEDDEDMDASLKFEGYVNKQNYFASIDQKKKPEIFTACNAVKALMENHRYP